MSTECKMAVRALREGESLNSYCLKVLKGAVSIFIESSLLGYYSPQYGYEG